MLDFIKSDTFRRMVAMLVGLVIPLINSKLGLNIPTEQVVAAIAALAVYIAQSGWKSANVQVAAIEAGTAAAANPAAVINS